MYISKLKYKVCTIELTEPLANATLCHSSEIPQCSPSAAPVVDNRVQGAVLGHLQGDKVFKKHLIMLLAWGPVWPLGARGEVKDPASVRVPPD